MRIFLILFLVFLTIMPSQYLDEYIHIGLKDNLALHQKNFSYQRSMAELKEARGLFMPSIGINARYSRASGGRTIDFPVGDMMNPVYDAINLTRMQSGLSAIPFPTLENEQIKFLREEEHNTKLQLIQPVFNLGILYNYKAKGRLADINYLERIYYARQLVHEIKSGYYNYLKAVRAAIILERSETVVKENLRVNQSLFKNDKITKDVVYRAEAELAEINQQRTVTENQRELARSYFNFLLNRNLDSKILAPDTLMLPEEKVLPLVEGKRIALHNREELKQLKNAIEAANYGEKAAGSKYLPTLTFVADYGYQGVEYDFSPEYNYWMASGILEWNLFSGFQDQAKKEQYRANQLELEARENYVKNQIELETEATWRDMGAFRKILTTAQIRLQSALASFKLVEKKYNEGMSNQLEFLDSRSTATRAALTETIARTEYLISLSNWERVLAQYPFDKLKPYEENE